MRDEDFDNIFIVGLLIEVLKLQSFSKFFNSGKIFQFSNRKLQN
jgi:hypothetical protein